MTGSDHFERKKIKSDEVITIREVTAQDAAQITHLTVEVFKSSEYLITQPEEYVVLSEERQRERLKKFIAEKGNVWLVAEFQNQLIGMLDFQNGKRERIKHKGSFGMSIHPSWRNRGVGQALLKSLIEWVRTHEFVEVINLGVMEENQPAIAVYKKLGFVETGRYPHEIKLPDGRYMADISMSLKVK